MASLAGLLCTVNTAHKSGPPPHESGVQLPVLRDGKKLVSREEESSVVEYLVTASGWGSQLCLW